VVNSCPPEASVNESYERRVADQKKLVETLKAQWKLLWSERFDDKEKAEGISVRDYDILLVERGLIIRATRNFKALNFREILEQKIVENPERYIAPDVHVGGWNKFIKKEISHNRVHKSKHVTSYSFEKGTGKRKGRQPKKGGRGWLHKV
jgi:hypothetical protein